MTEAPSMESLKSGEDSKEEPEEKQDKSAAATWLGAKVKEISPSVRQRLEIPESESGVIVDEVGPNTHAEQMGLSEGDIIRAVNQQVVTNLKSFGEAIKGVKTSKGVVLDILRGNESFYLSYMGPEK